jgi:hypothetical protein
MNAMRMKCFGIYCVCLSPQGIITSPRPLEVLRAVEEGNIFMKKGARGIMDKWGCERISVNVAQFSSDLD